MSEERVQFIASEAESAVKPSRGKKLSGAWTIPLGVAHVG